MAKNVDRDYGGTRGAWTSRHGDRSGRKLLAVGHYLESTVDIAESTRRIAASQIPADHMILMAGFTAGNEKGELVVLGRNGSDYSAAVLAACLRADCCEIWTDVDGVYTCDPRQCRTPLLKSMSYRSDGALLLRR